MALSQVLALRQRPFEKPWICLRALSLVHVSEVHTSQQTKRVRTRLKRYRKWYRC
jgi:hypothetical protein